MKLSTRSSSSALRAPLTRDQLGHGGGTEARVTLPISLPRLLLTLLVVTFAPAHLRAQAPAFACTPSIDFGTVAPGQFTLRSMWCTNMQAVPVAFDYGGTVGFEDFEPDPCVGGNCYDTFPMVIPPGGRFGITVAFHPSALGLRSGSQTILNNAGLPNSVTTFSGVGGTPSVPTLNGWADLALVAGLALVAVFVMTRHPFGGWCR